MARIQPVEYGEASAEIRALYDKLERDLGIAPNNFFKTMGHSPLLLKPLIDFSFAMLENGRLERRLKEWVILQIGRLHNCGYVYEAHKQALSRALMSDVLDDRQKPLDTSSFTDAEKLAIRYAQQVSESNVDEATFQELARTFDKEEIVELTVLAGYYNFICRVVSAFDIDFDQLKYMEPQTSG